MSAFELFVEVGQDLLLLVDFPVELSNVTPVLLKLALVSLDFFLLLFDLKTGVHELLLQANFLVLQSESATSLLHVVARRLHSDFSLEQIHVVAQHGLLESLKLLDVFLALFDEVLQILLLFVHSK